MRSVSSVLCERETMSLLLLRRRVVPCFAGRGLLEGQRSYCWRVGEERYAEWGLVRAPVLGRCRWTSERRPARDTPRANVCRPLDRFRSDLCLMGWSGIRFWEIAVRECIASGQSSLLARSLSQRATTILPFSPLRFFYSAF
jgi:hypothetical protein